MKKLTLLNLTVPIFVETLLFMLLGFADTFALSRISDIQAAAAGASNQVIIMFNLVFTVVSGATMILIAQNLGAKNREEASCIAAVSIIINLLVGIGCSLILVFGHSWILSKMGLSKNLFSYASQYLILVGGFLFLQSVLNTFTAILRSHGYTEFSMIVTLIMNITNIVLDLVLVLGLFSMPRLGIKGVAIATSFSRLVGVIIIGIFIFRKIESVKIFKMVVPLPKKSIRNIFKIGIPSAFEALNYQIYQMFVTMIILKYMNDLDFAAKNYIQNIVMFVYVFSVAIGQANQVMIGHLVGARKFQEAKETGFKCVKISLSITLVLSIGVYLFRQNAIEFFTDDPYIVQMACKLLWIDIFVEFGRTFNIVVIDGLRGAGDTIYPVIMALIFMWGIGALGTYILGVQWSMGLIGAWIAFALDECIRGVLMIHRWKKEKWMDMIRRYS